MSGQNRLLRPNEIMVEDGVLIFYLENQGVYQWATICEGDDPLVLGRYESSDPWTPEEMNLSDHLIRMCLFEAIMSAPYSASPGWLEPEEFERLCKSFSLVLSAWHWPGPSRFYVGEGVFMHASTYPKDASKSGYSLWMGAKNSRTLGLPQTFPRQGLGSRRVLARSLVYRLLHSWTNPTSLILESVCDS